MALLWCSWHHWEFNRRADKAFTKWLPVAGRRGLYWKKCSLNDCTVVHLSELKWFWIHSEATMYINNSFTVCLPIHFKLLDYFSLTMKAFQYFQTLTITHTMTCYIPEDLMLLLNHSRNISCNLLKQHAHVSEKQCVCVCVCYPCKWLHQHYARPVL